MKTVTITKDQFHEAVNKANEKFKNIGKDKMKEDPMMDLMMGLQNVMFGALISDILFDNKEEM